LYVIAGSFALHAKAFPFCLDAATTSATSKADALNSIELSEICGAISQLWYGELDDGKLLTAWS
jgi:hypothetical protein